MSKRKEIPTEIETRLLTASGRRCCLCFGLNNDFDEKQGQIAHLDRDSSNYDFENLAWLCLDHHDQYDTRTSQSKGLTIHEVKQYRSRLYEELEEMRRPPDSKWPVELDVPLLRYFSVAAPTGGLAGEGIQFTDKVLSKRQHPTLYVTAYFKNTRYFGANIPGSKEKWLYFEAKMSSAFSLRIQVCAFNDRDVFGLMNVLRNKPEFGRYTPAWNLPGPKIGEAADYILISRENGENRFTMSTFTQTYAAISIHARFSAETTLAFADYLDQVGYSKPFNDYSKLVDC